MVVLGVVLLAWTRVLSHAAQAPKTSTARRLGVSAVVQTHRNIGKAYYEQGKYPEAIAEFQKVMAAGHALATDHLDLGMALMQANDLDKALGELTTARQMDPKLVAVEYDLGILYKRELRYPDAEAALKRVIEADPDDPAAWFNLGAVYFAERQLQPALDAEKHVIGMGFGRGQNFYVAALFHAFTITNRLRQPAEAQKYLKLHEQFKDKVPNISVMNPALEAGKYGAILVPPSPPVVVASRANARVTFADISAKLGIDLAAPPVADAAHALASKISGPSVAIGDYDGDGRPDLYVVNPDGSSRLFHNNGDGTFADVTGKAGLGNQGASLSATFADYDNSGHPSLFVAGVSGVTLYHNNGNGTFTDATAKSGLRASDAGSGEVATRAVLFDADDDGFLDLVVTDYSDSGGSGRVRFYRNNADGTFSDLTSASGLGSATGKMRGALFADFNNDGYSDLLLYRDDGPPLLFLNQGEDKFRDATREASEALAQSRVLGAQAADFNHDGNFDLALWTPSGCEVLLNRGDAKFSAVKDLPAFHPPDSPSAFRGTVADLNGDGFADLLAADVSGKLHFLANHAGRFVEEPIALPAGAARLAFATAVSLTNLGKLDLIGVRPNGQIAALEKQGPPAHWVEVKLDGYKSNKAGVGTIVEFKAGDFYDKVMATGGPVRVFTGGRAKLDVVRVTWPNLVVQNSIDVPAGKALDVRESERLASSCPFLYVWNGHAYTFLTDILGVAPLGELAPDGSRIKPDPDQLVRLGSELHATDGALKFQLTDEMRETDYVDQLRLLAVDHPESENVYANEIYSSLPAPLDLYIVRNKRSPVSAIDDHGTNVLRLVRNLDGSYPSNFRRDRILGLAELHSLTLDLGSAPLGPHPALYLTGWVFWTDSNAARALMTTHRRQMISPYLQVRDAHGQWVTVIPDMGLPGGTDRTMRIDLSGKLLSQDHHVRIVTNLCVYWDRIFFTTDDAILATPLGAGSNRQASADLAPVEMPLVAAHLHYRGFSTPVSDPRHVNPDWFDYAHLMTTAPWNPFFGRYTRYGNVRNLVTRADDHLVVMATGDEMTLKFSTGGLPPLKPGWKRDYFLYARGYAKDGEPNTADFRTSGPLPFYGMANYPYAPREQYPGDNAQRRYVREYETRRGYALIPPLAP